MIITLCGSMRFFDKMMQVAGELTKEGHVVLAPFVGIACDKQDSDMKKALDVLHMQKIDMCEQVVIVSDGDAYMGNSTRRELDYALRNGKTVSMRRIP